MAEVIVYGSPASPFARAVRVALFERGIAHKMVVLSRAQRALEESLARHPFAKIPVLDHDGFLVYETQAIVRYVAQAFPGPDLTPPGARQAARMNQAIGVIDAYVFSRASSPIAGERILARLSGGTADENKIAAALPDAAKCLDAMENLLGDKPYFGGDGLSLGDIHAGPHVAILNAVEEGRAMLPGFPRLQAWLVRLERRDSFQATQPQLA